MRTRDYFSYFLGIGITLMIGIQAIINIGVTTGLLPTKGLPLPFISWGGSSLLINMASAGILMSIGMRNREQGGWCFDGRWKIEGGRRDIA
jgi:cell division protein FtsW